MRRTFWAWVRLLGGAAILGLLVWRLGTGAFLDGLRVIDAGTLLAALGIGLLTTVFSAWRWCLVARGLGIRLPLGRAVADYYRGLFLNAALPGGVLGDVHRAVRHGQDVDDVGRGVRAVVLERSAGQVVLIGVGAVVLLLAGPVPLPAGAGSGPAGWSVALVLAAAVLLGLAGWFLLRSRPRSSRWHRACRTAVSDVRLGLLARHTWPGIALCSAVVLAGHLATFVVAARAAGSSAPLARLVPLMLLALIAMALPLNVGGWGPREGVTAWAFGAAGLGASLGLTVAVVYGVLAFVASLPGVAVLVARWLGGLRADRLRADRLGTDELRTDRLRTARVPLPRAVT
ncbi:lysylphosphatidylglycerol synthase transmembrane domain-containing protein [Plantactinospora sp. WMMC1484]|uniref:lysylphosphatidylglycerol synthase transmembrane domain-containing protein n=1 Tax=Plantactinospora sp. WMMC1484 TaxID=3404122 RepID=UPI003BF61DBA